MIRVTKKENLFLFFSRCCADDYNEWGVSKSHILVWFIWNALQNKLLAGEMITCTPKLLSGQEWMMCMEWSLFFLICSFKLPSSIIHSGSLILYDKAVLVSVWFNPYWAYFFFANTNMFTQFLTMNALSFSRSSLCLHELPYNIPLWVDFWCLLHAWQQQRRATKTAAAQGVLTALCFPLLVISATPIRTRHSECIRPCACLGCALDVHTCTGLRCCRR